MKSFINFGLAGIFWQGLTALPTPAFADEIRVGVMAHGVDVPPSGVRGGREDGVSLTGEYIFDTPNWPKWTLGARPYIYGSINLAGDTSHAGVGLNWRQSLGDKFYAEIGGGFSVHNGTNRIDFPSEAVLRAMTNEQRIALLAPLFERRRNEIQFGSRVQFRGQGAGGYRISDQWSAEFVYEHLSNGQILGGPQNDGLDSLGIRLARKF
ncbi:MAG: acyloxyacyl hydrolase [Robiginitomaculum sp.]|nr:acyloxyacyl hydrolase [Robiginitomaculum sp.]